MKIDDALRKAYQDELEALEKFRIAYAGMFPAAPLERDDPDVRRLIEAMALFSARARTAAERNVAYSTTKLFRQHFSYVLSPVPSMGLLQAETHRNHADFVELSRGTPVLLSKRVELGPGEVESRELTFRTSMPARILPVEFTEVETIPRRGGGVRLVLAFEASSERPEPVGRVSLYINHFAEFLSSLTVFHSLRKNLEQASVVYDQPVRLETAGAPCSVHFGAAPDGGIPNLAGEHPMERVRAFLSFPEQDLFLHVDVADRGARWRRFALVFDLGSGWPAALRLPKETFGLGVVPIVNLKKESADPFEFDGTRARHLVRHPEPRQMYRTHSVLGVYRFSDQGLLPLRPGVVSGGADTYEIENQGRGLERQTYVEPELPGAFASPTKVSVEALWYQPVTRHWGAGGYGAQLGERFLEGVRWFALGTLSPDQDNPLADDQEGLLELLSIRNQRFLGDLASLQILLRAIGATRSPHFGEVLRGLRQVDVSPTPSGRTATGFKYVYTLIFDDLGAHQLPLLELLAPKLLELLVAWSTEEVVELTVQVPKEDVVLRVNQGLLS